MSDLIHTEISQSIKALKDSHTNLNEIVKHCTTINQNQGNREQTLQETKNYALQALSSVAYQVNVAAGKFEELIRWQESEMNEMSAELNTVYYSVGFSGEAALAATLSKQGIVCSEKPMNLKKNAQAPSAFRIEDKSNYKIDFTQLDHVGRGQFEYNSSVRTASMSQSNPPPTQESSLTRSNTTASTSTSSVSGILSFKSRPNTSAPAPRPPTVGGITHISSVPTIPVPRAPSVFNPSDVPPPPPADVPPPPPPTSSIPPPPQETQMNVSVLYDYEAQNPDELTIRVGEILTVLNPDAGGGWMEGRNSSGKSGLFPQTYVENI